jgi:Domain of unknown function (DUF4815)
MPLDTNFNVDPYYDDYDEAKNFHRVLFRPAVAVQARELTQLQSILQNQIERFGDNIFIQGTIIQGCNFNFDSNYNFIKLPDLRVDGQTVVPSDYVGLRLVSTTTSNLQAIVVNSQNGLESQNPDLHTLYIKYLNSGVNGEKAFANSEQLAVYSNTDVSNTTTLVTSLAIKVAPSQINSVNTNPVGVGYSFTVGEGIVFQKGVFIKVEAPITAVISKYSNAPDNVSVGFATNETIITEYTDPSLYDNASGYTNANAPGAHRLKLTPTLVVANTNALPANNFLSLVDWQSGNPVRLNQGTQYNVINKEMARREFETNGNFVIKPFKFNAETDVTSSNNFNVTVSAGLAYIDGYRVELTNSIKQSLRRGIDTKTLNSQNISLGYGNYIVIQEVGGYFSVGASINLYDTASSVITNESYSSISPSGNIIGTATVLSLIYKSGTVDTPTAQYYLYLTNIQMNSGKTFTAVKGFASATGIADAVLTYKTSLGANVAVLLDPDLSMTMFPTGKSYVKTLTPGASVNTSFVFRKNDTVNINSNGVSLAITLTGNQQFYYGTGTLTSIQEQAVIVIPTSNINVVNAAGTVTTTNGSPNVVGTSTTFLSSYQENDYIRFGNSSVYTTKRIKSIANDTLIVVSNTIANAYSSNSHNKVYPKNVPINFSDRNSSITLSNTTSMTFTLKNAANTAESLQAAANVSIYYDVKSITTPAIQKTSNQSRFVCIDTALFLPFSANITCNTATNVISTTNSAVNNYISPGYNLYLSGTNSNVALLGTVASVNSTAVVLTANATSNVFTFVPLGGTITCNTTNSIVTSTNSAVNTYVSAGYQIYLASNSLFLGTVASSNTSTFTLTTNATANITANAVTFSSATNQITISANNSVGPAGPWYLGLPDVYKLRSVYKIASGNTFTTNSVYDVTSSFDIQTNQTDTSYLISQLIKRPSSSNIPVINGDKLTVVFDVFTIPSSGSPGFFTVDSYPIDDANTANTVAIQTQNIPYYKTSTGEVISLRDYIDFRAYASNTISLISTANLQNASANATVINPLGSNTFSTTGFITPSQAFGYDVIYYLPREDVLYLTTAGNMVIIEGTPAENPQPPAGSSAGMPIGTCSIPPYPSLIPSQIDQSTVDKKTITFTTTQNSRYTMKDIDTINKRVDKLEYYSALSLLEQQTKNLVIKNSAGQDRFKNGIFVDTFETLDGSNVNDSEYFISFNTSENSIITRFDEFKIELKYDINENANTYTHNHTKTNDTVTLRYTETPYLSQGTATRIRNVTDGQYNWVGTLYSSPPYDNYPDTSDTMSPPPPIVAASNTSQVSVGGENQPVFVRRIPTFPRSASGNLVYVNEIEGYMYIPDQYLGGVISGANTTFLQFPPKQYNSDLGFYSANGLQLTTGPIIQGNSTIVYNSNTTSAGTSGRDPVIPPGAGRPNFNDAMASPTSTKTKIISVSTDPYSYQ